MNRILRLLEKNSQLTAEQIAGMLDLSVCEVKEYITKMEKEKVVVGYNAIIDWEKTDTELVSAVIELKVTPQREQGFERVAERICQYAEVDSAYLMSGGYDIMVIINGKTFKEVALFVGEKLAPLEYVTQTSTHFVLKRFKEKGISYSSSVPAQERVIIL